MILPSTCAILDSAAQWLSANSSTSSEQQLSLIEQLRGMVKEFLDNGNVNTADIGKSEREKECERRKSAVKESGIFGNNSMAIV